MSKVSETTNGNRGIVPGNSPSRSDLSHLCHVCVRSETCDEGQEEEEEVIEEEESLSQGKQHDEIYTIIKLQMSVDVMHSCFQAGRTNTKSEFMEAFGHRLQSQHTCG